MNEADWWIDEDASDLKGLTPNPKKIVWASVLLLGLPVTAVVCFLVLHGH